MRYPSAFHMTLISLARIFLTLSVSLIKIENLSIYVYSVYFQFLVVCIDIWLWNLSPTFHWISFVQLETIHIRKRLRSWVEVWYVSFIKYIKYESIIIDQSKFTIVITWFKWITLNFVLYSSSSLSTNFVDKLD